MHETDAGEHFEQFARIWLDEPVPPDAILIRPGLALA
jgi:hypothetical protein